MGLFNRREKDFNLLYNEIEKRAALYDLILSEGSEPHPAGLELVANEFHNLMKKAASIKKHGKPELE